MDPTTYPSYTHREYQQWNLPRQQRVNSISHILPSGDHEGQPVSEVSYFQGAHGFVDTGAIYLTINGNFDARPQPPPPFPPGNRFSPTPQRTCPEMKCSFYENAYDFMIDAPTFLSIDGDVQGPLDLSLFYPTAPNAYTPRHPRPMTVLPACNAHVPITKPRRPAVLQGRDSTNNLQLSRDASTTLHRETQTMGGCRPPGGNTKRHLGRGQGFQKQNKFH